MKPIALTLAAGALFAVGMLFSSAGSLAHTNKGRRLADIVAVLSFGGAVYCLVEAVEWFAP